jgi:hypothetical protein
MTARAGAQGGPAHELASPNVGTFDAARALGVSPSGVLHLIATAQLPCRRLPSGRREIPRVAVLALVERRARAALALELWPARRPAPRVDGQAQQLKLWQVRRPRPAKVAPAIGTAKVRRIA